jgi:hypothetical protein
MEVQIAVAKVNKYAVSESGDTLEVVERPNGGLSVVLADGQSSGRGAKAISQMVVRKVIGCLQKVFEMVLQPVQPLTRCLPTNRGK